jgi:methylase of polypeptide subunit release factors
MGLPDLSRLSACDPRTLRAFGRHLQTLGMNATGVRPFLALAASVPPHVRKPARDFHLSMRVDPLSCAVRMFFFRHPVPEEGARAACGELFEPFVEVGLLTRDDAGRYASPFRLGLVDDVYVLSDELSLGEGAAMGYGDSTVALCRASLPDRPIDRALDLGCGSGTAALILARRAKLAIGTDINPRAIEMSWVNARLNGIENVDFRVGDLFAPVAGESFDVIVSQPPFIPMPDGIAPSTFQFGGSRGDELVLKMLPQVPRHLAPGGRAILVIEWPEDGTSLEDRAREAISSPDVNVLVLATPTTDADDHATSYAALSHPDLGPPFEEEATRRREHFQRTKVTGMTPTFTTIHRTTSPGWTHLVSIGPFPRVTVTSERIEKLVEGRTLSADPSSLLAAKLRMPDGTVLGQQQNGPGADVESTLHARFSRLALTPPIELTVDQLALFTAVHESPNVQAAVGTFADATGLPPDEAFDRALPLVIQALRSGVLEIAG